MRILNMIRNHSNWFDYLVYKYFTPHTKDFTFKGRSGLNITVPQRLLQTYKECFFDQTYFKGLPDLAFRKDPVVIDFGANVGYFSLSAFARFPEAHVFAFEPMPVNFKLLTKYRNENPALNFSIINKAVSDKNGTLTLQYDAGDSFTTAASVFEGNQKDKLEVQTVTLQSVVEEHRLDRIDFLKLDCEGSEYPILYSAPKAVLDKIRVLAIETHPGKGDKENIHALEEFLKQNGFNTATRRDIIWAWRN